MTTSIQAIIWDFGGVLVRTEDWEPRFVWERRLGLKKMGLTDMVFNSRVAQEASVGKADAEDIWRWIGQELKLSNQALDTLRQDYWRGDQVDYELIETIRTLKGNYKTALLSNAWPSLRAAIEGQWKFDDAFDVMVISAEVGMVKPDPEIYLYALDQLQVEPSNAVFVDDFQENIDGARAVGMHAIHFQDSKLALSELNHLLEA